jgi:hypothetical protein
MPSTSDAATTAAVQHQKAVQSPLTLIMTIKSKDDYDQLYKLLHDIQELPPDKNPVWVALTKLNNVHFARFVFLEKNTKLAVITTYDGTFEDYIADFTREIGGIFDALLAHMVGAPPLPVEKNAKAFLDYVRANDLRGMEPFYSAYPKSTVTDIKAFLRDQE